MANWYAGGLKALNDLASPWPDAAGATDFYASLVAGGTSLTLNNPDWLTLSDFLSGNPGFSLMSDAKNVSVTGKVEQWDATGNEHLFIINGQTVFSAPAGGQNYAGVLFHDKTDVDPAACTLWAFEPSVAGNNQTGGGNVNWGGTGSNVFLRLGLQLVVFPAECPRGAIQLIYPFPNRWNDAGYDLGYALIKTGGWSEEWITVADAKAAGMTFCANCGPGEVNSPLVTGAQRLATTYDNDANELQYNIGSGFDVIFNAADGSWEVGAPVTGIMAYIFPTGAYTDAAAYLWKLDFATLTLAAGVSIRYGNASKQSVRVRIV